MFKCKEAMDAKCGKNCCCLECNELDTCDEACESVCGGKYKHPSECSEAFEETADLVVFETNAATVIQEIANIANQKKALEEQDKEMRAELERVMDLYGVKSFENDIIKISYVEPTTRTTIDSAKLKKKYPTIAEECSKTSEVKGSVRITVK